MKSQVSIKDGLVLYTLYHLFDILRQVSCFQQIRNISNCIWKFQHRHELELCDEEQRKQLYQQTRPFTLSYLFPELWVVGNLFCGIIIYLCITNEIFPQWLKVVCAICAFLRTFEIFVYQVNVLLFDAIKSGYSSYQIKSATRMLCLLIINMFEYVIGFSIIYAVLLDNVPLQPTLYLFSRSLFWFFNLDAPNPDCTSVLALTMAHIEAIMGVFMNLICIGRFISLLPTVNTIDNH